MSDLSRNKSLPIILIHQGKVAIVSTSEENRRVQERMSKLKPIHITPKSIKELKQALKNAKGKVIVLDDLSDFIKNNTSKKLKHK